MIRGATIRDVKTMQRLINYYAKKDEMLPRSLSELYDNLRNYLVYESKGKILGCCALHVCWHNLGEIKSLAVQKTRQKQGIGKKLLLKCLADAKKLKLKKIFVLTYKPLYFKKFGFKDIDKSELPHKIWSECIKCVKFPNCDEIALQKEI